MSEAREKAREKTRRKVRRQGRCARFLALARLVGLGALTTLAACEHSTADGVASDRQAADDGSPLIGGVLSLTSLGETVIAGLVAEDVETLEALLVDPADFKGRLFAALSNHASAAQMGPELIWDMQRREGADELRRALRAYRGRSLRLLSVEVDAEERRAGIILHRRPSLRVLDEESGREETLHILGSVIEHPVSGTFVLLTYRVRDSP